jgi:acetyl-CoA carboxylase/biotin carboxylase 1
VPNGVTHWEAKNDMAALHVVLKYLDYVPEVCNSGIGCRPRALTLPLVDSIDRDVTFLPGRDETYDPRFLVHGNPATGTSGLFDAGSWQEALSGWAKTVVVGRATLQGTPCGVILVETRITKKFDPADPADPTSTSTFVSQAGQVWFPDSARKTADALEDFHRERLPCFILANWRGFSGGMRDMYDEVLKFGASIVDNLRVYQAPVFIYIPPFGELRGGAWVVVDPVINHHGVVEMYCDATARGGILEPAGVVEIKFREPELRELIRRNDRQVAQLIASDDASEAKKRESALLPLYNDIAVHFADLHDTPGRMKAKQCVLDIIPWKDSRRVFGVKLQRKLKEVQMALQLVSRGVAGNLEEAIRKLVDGKQDWAPGASWHTHDREALAYMERPETAQALELQSRVATASRLLETMKTAMGALGGEEETRACLQTILQDDKVRLMVESLLRSPK